MVRGTVKLRPGDTNSEGQKTLLRLAKLLRLVLLVLQLGANKIDTHKYLHFRIYALNGLLSSHFFMYFGPVNTIADSDTLKTSK